MSTESAQYARKTQSMHRILIRLLGLILDHFRSFDKREPIECYNENTHSRVLEQVMANPFLTKASKVSTYSQVKETEVSRNASVNGVIMRSFGMFAVLVATAMFAWATHLASVFAIPAALLAWVIVWSAYHRNAVNASVAFLYAGLEGLTIGIVSSLYESVHPGIVKTAVVSTLVTAGVLFVLWRANIIRVTSIYKRRFYNLLVAYIILSLGNILYTWVSGSGGVFASKYGWLACLFGCALASASLVTDFAQIEDAVSKQLPESAEWNLSLGLMVSLLWLYLEILRLNGRK